MEEEQIYDGALIDNRPKELKAQDFTHEEVASSAPTVLVEKSPDKFKKYPVRDQDGSSTCLMQATAKVLGVENTLEEPDKPFIVFSARDGYERRLNSPEKGMYLYDALSIASKFGLTTEEKLPSQKMSEEQINAPFTRTEEDLKIANTYRAGGYVNLDINFDAIADVVLNQKKGVVILTFAQNNEWIDVPVIKNPDLKKENAPIRHGVAVVDAFLWKGERALLIDDSWGRFYGFEGQRVLTESWIKERVYGAGYLLDLSNKRQEEVPVPNKPVFHFNNPLTFGTVSPSVVDLQNMLKFEECFPQKIESTGKYLQITARGVKAWQIKHGIMDFANEKDVRKVRFGEKSIKLANQLYS